MGGPEGSVLAEGLLDCLSLPGPPDWGSSLVVHIKIVTVPILVYDGLLDKNHSKQGLIMKAFPALVGCMLLLVGVMAGCGAPQSGRADGRLSVVAAESPWGAVARALGGERVVVTSLISSPGADPHEYMASAPAAAAVSTASVVVENGLGYDGFMNRLLSTSSPKDRVVVSAARTLGVEGTNANPHLFYALRFATRVAQAIEQAYVKVDPTHHSTYEANLSAFRNAMAPVLSELDHLQSSYAGIKVAQTERLAGYLLEEAGLKVVGPEGFAAAIEAGREPNASDQLTFEALLSRGAVHALVVSRGAQSSATRTVVTRAREHGVPVVFMSELVIPENASYPTWMGAQISSLSRALGAAA